MAKTTPQLRELWAAYECAESQMVTIEFCGDRVRVAPGTEDAWAALASILTRHGYEVRPGDTDSYNCRTITGGSGKSLHSYGIALDVNWKTNPYIDHAGERQVKFSDGMSQEERAIDVKEHRADTDMTPAMIADVEGIKTKAGIRVFDWGGNWTSVKDAMHFELDVSPAELAAGIDWTSVQSSPMPHASPAPVTPALGPTGDLHYVISRSDLRLRSTPSQSAGIIRTVPNGTSVNVMSLSGEWALVDLEGDGRADGYMFYEFLSRTPPSPRAMPVTPSQPATGGDQLAVFTPALVKKMFPATNLANIERYLPFVLSGLRARRLTDRDMALMALATIRAETEGFEPISEYKSKYNTSLPNGKPFALYDGRTDLGNTQAGDGERFKGRGFVQLTGRHNYRETGEALGIDLVGSPGDANDPTTAGLVLAEFLRRRESAIRSALAEGRLDKARKLVNGGSHGIERFKDAFARGRGALGQ